MKTFALIAALLASLLLTGCETRVPTPSNPGPTVRPPAAPTTPAEDSPGWDCRKHGDGQCVRLSP